METILIFEPLSGGHRAQFIRWLAEYLSGQSRQDVLFVFVVGPGMDVPVSDTVSVHRISAETARLLENAGRWTKPWRLNRIFRKVCAEYRPAHTVILEMTHLELPLALTGAPCPISAILFVQYPELKRGLKFYLKEWKTDLLLRRAPVKNLFLLNGEEACRYLTTRFGTRARFIPLPDPVPEIAAEASFSLRDEYGIAAERTVFLFFGAVSRRKGAPVLVEALQQIDPSVVEKSAFIFCGQVEPPYREAFQKACKKLVEARPDIQLSMEDRFVPDERMMALCEQSDVLLMPYTRPEYSSGMFALAAKARTPVIGPDAGLLGRLIRRHDLGLPVEINSAALTVAITLFAEKPIPVNAEKQRAFVEKSRPDVFASQLIEAVCNEA